jgi:hypothetical protein
MTTQSQSSILYRPAAIAVMGNEHAYQDLCIFLDTLQLWNEDLPPIYCFCTKGLQTKVQTEMQRYKGTIHYRHDLELYVALNRQTMEQMPSQQGLSNFFHDFTIEKCELMKWALESVPESEKEQGVLFCDADIAWFGPLVQIPKGKTLALSQHMIRKRDEAKYGEFNAGLVWTNQTTMPEEWKEASKRSRFFEQAALEELADLTLEKHLVRFDETINYGWWRMFQSDIDATVKQREWTFISEPSHSGIRVNGKPLVCIHTHFKTDDYITHTFNSFVKQFLARGKGATLDTLKSILTGVGGNSIRS